MFNPATPAGRFGTLLLREWMQHRRGWILLALLPPAVMALLALLDSGVLMVDASIQLDGMPPMGALPPLLQTLSWTTVSLLATGVLVVLAVSFQLPGLARRDLQDRSLEFWRTLPVGHAGAVAATLLAQLVLLPAAALTVAVVAGQLAGTVSVLRHSGLAAWATQPWGVLLPLLLVLVLRIWLGVLLAVAWLAPLLLLVLAATAWLRRWGLLVVATAVLVGVYWLDPRLPGPWVQASLRTLFTESLAALIPVRMIEALPMTDAPALTAALQGAAGLLARDALAALADLASPQFAAVLAVAGLAFAGAVAHRARGS